VRQHFLLALQEVGIFIILPLFRFPLRKKKAFCCLP
jgi:hypothetical protein